MNWKNIFIVFIFLLVIMIVIEITKKITLSRCSVEKVKYRYLPRTFNEEMDEQPPIKDIYRNMFNNRDPWIF
jgi:hypothetical protein